MLAVVAFFKIRFAWHTDLLVTHGVLHRLRDAGRYRVVLAAFAGALLRFGDWSLSIPPLLIVYLLVLVCESRRADWQSRSALLPWV